MSSAPAKPRFAQLDGLRALSVLGVACVHWVPAAWRIWLPVENGLFFFLTLSGYLITRSLLRDPSRDYTAYIKKRCWRIWLPYLCVLVLALCLGAPDVRHALLWYALPLANWHIARSPDWPAYTAHFWSLAVQMQFYLIWPLLLWKCPRRFLTTALLLLACLAPLSRVFLSDIFSLQNACAWNSLDLLALGSLLAWREHQGLRHNHFAWKIFAIFCTLAYAGFYAAYAKDLPLHGWGALQQSCLAIVCSALIVCATQAPRALRFLETPFLQRLGTISYSFYLIHNLAPRLVGWLLPFLWWESWIPNPILATSLQVLCCFAVAYFLATQLWKWIEVPCSQGKLPFHRENSI